MLRRTMAIRISTLIVVLAGATACTDMSGPSTTAPTTQTPTTRPAAAAAAAVAAAPSSDVTAAAAVFSDGTWKVGGSIPPGQYQTIAAAPEACYWWVYIGNLDKIISYGTAAKAARPMLTLEAGQDFQVWHCGGWVKVSG
jgi:hypothetical protein